MVIHFVILILMSLTSQVWAQIDPASAVLLRSGSTVPSKERLESDRYTVRPSGSEPKATATTAPPQEGKRPAAATSGTSTPSAAPKVVVKTAKPVDEASTQPSTSSNTNSKGPPSEEVPVEEAGGLASDAKEKESLSVKEQVKVLVLGGSEEEIENYRGQLHPEDTRNNLMEITVAPVYLYNDSSANYWYRRYHHGSPGFLIGADVWMTPFFGFHASLLSTQSGSIQAAPGGTDRLAVDHQWFEAGLRMRKYLSLSRKAPSLSLGLDFSEYQMRVPPDATDRIRLKTTGVKISFETTLPQGNGFAWQLGAFVLPRGDHKEGFTGISVSSGSRDNTMTLGLMIGGQHTFDRSSQVFWRLQHSVEQSLYEGAASAVDPVTGVVPNTVTVTNSFSIFQLGYRWGN